MQRISVLAWMPVIVLATALSACETIIDVDIDEAAPRLVVEAEVAEGPGPHIVHLSRSVGIHEASVFPEVSGAWVVITDDAGHADTLQETTAGYYQTSHLVGVPGATYQLSILDEGTTYTASSTMPQPVAIDSVYNFSAGFFGGTRYPVVVVLQDPANVRNQYRFINYVNGKRKNGSNSENDELFDGQATQIFLPGVGGSVVPGDTLLIEMQCIDAAVFNYFDSFESNGNGPGGSSAPANPYSNVEGGAMGYFNACTKSTRSVIIR